MLSILGLDKCAHCLKELTEEDPKHLIFTQERIVWGPSEMPGQFRNVTKYICNSCKAKDIEFQIIHTEIEIEESPGRLRIKLEDLKRELEVLRDDK